MKANLVEAINHTLSLAMEHDPRIVLLGQDIGINGGVFRVTDGLQKKFGKERVIDTPLSEAAIIGAAIGMAINGLRPVAEIQFAGFMYEGYHMLKSQASKIRSRSRGRFTVPLVIRTPSGGGIRAIEDHSDSMEAIYAHTPGLKVVIPSSPSEAKGLLLASISDPDPVIFFEPERLYRAFREEISEEPYLIPLGKARIARAGNAVTIITYGPMVPTTLEAVEQAHVDAEVIDLRTIVPLDVETIIASVTKTGRALIVHEGPRSFGVGAEVAAQIAEKALLSLQAPVIRVTGYDVPFPCFLLEEQYIPSIARIIKGLEQVMS